MTATDQPTDAGTARSPGISYQDLLDADTHPVPDVLRLESPRYLGSEDVPVERYTSREWYEKEKERQLESYLAVGRATDGSHYIAPAPGYNLTTGY